jgi:hypothetical protein
MSVGSDVSNAFSKRFHRVVLCSENSFRFVLAIFDPCCSDNVDRRIIVIDLFVFLPPAGANYNIVDPVKPTVI